MLKPAGLASWPRARVSALVRSPLYRNGYALILNSASTSGLGVLYWIIAAHLYPAEVVGLNSAAISAMMLISTLSRVNLNDALLRFIPSAGRTASRLVAYAYLVSLTLALAAGLLLFLGLTIFPSALTFLRAGPLFSAVFLTSVMAWSIFGLQDYVLAGARQAHWVPIENSAFAAIKIVLLFFFASVFTQFGIFASWTIPVVLSLLPVNYLIFRYVLPKHMRAGDVNALPGEPGQIARFAVGNYVGSLFWMAATMALPTIVTEVLGVRANAYFYPAWLIASSLQRVAASMATSLTVEASRDQTKLGSYSRRVFKHTAKLLVPLVGGTLVAAPFILRIFGSDYEREGTVVLQLLTLSAFPYLIMVLYLSEASVQRNIKGMVVVQAVFCLMVLGLSVILLQVAGITGVGMAWLAAQCLVALLLLFRRWLRSRAADSPAASS